VRLSSRAIKQCPGARILPAEWRIRNPLHPSDDGDVSQARQKRLCLLGEEPIRVDQQPRRRWVAQVDEDRVQEGATPRAIRDENDVVARLGVAMDPRVDGQIVCCDEDVSGALEVCDELPIATTRLNKFRVLLEALEQWLNRCRRSAIGILRVNAGTRSACPRPSAFRRLAPTTDVIVLSARIAPSRRRFETRPRLTGERRDGFGERRTTDVLREPEAVAALATAATVPKLLFRVDAEAIPAAGDRTSTNVFPGANAFERAEALSGLENVGASRALDRFDRDAHGLRRREAAGIWGGASSIALRARATTSGTHCVARPSTTFVGIGLRR
jgi:hypothetical protein